jgi:hypothetical protein
MEMKVEQRQWRVDRGWDPPLDSSGLGSAAQLVFLFGNPKWVELDHCIAPVRDAYPKAHIVGCSTGGEIMGAEVSDGSLALTAVTFGTSRVATASVDIASVDRCEEAGRRLMGQLDPAGLRHVFVLSEGLLVNGSDLTAGIAKALPAGVSASGGFAADGNLLQETHVWCDGNPQRSSAVAVGFYGERLRIGVSVTSGWHPFGPNRIITRSAKNVLYEFDNRPALALYKQYLGEHAVGLPASGLNFPLEVSFGEHRVLRALLAVDEKEQSITYAGNVPEGALARFMMGQIEDLIDGALKASQASLENLGLPSPRLALLVSCNARRAVLRQRVDQEVEAVREVLGPSTTLAGFYSYGEIAAVQKGSVPELHNETMIITTIAED